MARKEREGGERRAVNLGKGKPNNWRDGAASSTAALARGARATWLCLVSGICVTRAPRGEPA